MAYIDKIHLDKKDIPEFISYLKSIDNDFKKYFNTDTSLLDYVFNRAKGDLSTIIRDTDISVAEFPWIVDRWLAHREDLLPTIKENLLFQYNGEALFSEPIYKEVTDDNISHKFKIVKWHPYKGRKQRITTSGWMFFMEELDEYFTVRRSSKDDSLSTNLLDLPVPYCKLPSCYMEFKSLKAIFRFLRKYGFPKGTKIDLGHLFGGGSSITIKFI